MCRPDNYRGRFSFYATACNTFQMKTVAIKRFDGGLPLPEYKTKGAVAFDLYARKDVVIKAGEVGYVPLNVAVECPKGYFFVLAARSSTHKRGIMPVNGIGIGDEDFCGDDDEWKLAALNFTKKTVKIERGARIAQGMYVKFERAKWKEVKKMKAKTRGGIGSTGGHRGK